MSTPATSGAQPGAQGRASGSAANNGEEHDLGTTVADFAGQAQERAQDLAGQARARARDEVNRRTTDFAQRASGTASDLRSVAEQLRAQGKDQPAEIVEQAAERVYRVAGYLERSDGNRMVHDLERLGRQRPWAATTGGLALGLFASRLLKASSGERYRAQGGAATTRRTRGSLPSSTGAGGRAATATGAGAGTGYSPGLT